MWDSLEEATGQPVRKIMDSWIFQPGFPLVTARRDGDRVTLSQQRFSYLGGANTATFGSSSVTVPARGSATVGVNIQAGAWPDKSLYGGYVVLAPHGGGVTLRVPYVGFKGDYQSLPVLTGASCGLPAVFQIKAGAADSCLGPGISRLGGTGAAFA